MSKGILDISPGAYEEIKTRLAACGAGERIKHNFYDAGDAAPTCGVEILDFGEIALRREADEDVRVWILYHGQKL